MSSLFASAIDEPTGKCLLLMLDRATSEYLPGAEPDWTIFMEVCDMIRSREVTGKEAMRSIRRRLLHPNPNVQLLALKLLDAAIKNGGHLFLVEVASREMVDCLSMMVKGQWLDLGLTEEFRQPVQQLATFLFQTWALLFMIHPDLLYLHAVYEELSREGVEFPPPPSDLQLELVESAAPAEWRDADKCERCRTPFTLTLRKHHCRRCGGCFCHDCSAKQHTLPELGIMQLVRVCEACYVAKTKPPAEPKKKLPAKPKDDSDDEEFKKAIELSLREQKQSAPRKVEDEEDAQVAAAIAASLQQPQQPGIFLSSGATATIPDTISPNELSNTATPPISSISNTVTIPVYSPVFNPVPSKSPVPVALEYISGAERENVRLFDELMIKLSEAGPNPPIAKDDADLQALAKEMSQLRDRLRKGVLMGQIPSTSDLDRLMAMLDSSLKKFEVIPETNTVPIKKIMPALQPTKMLLDVDAEAELEKEEDEQEEKLLIEL